MEEAGFTLIEALGVKGIRKMVQMIIQMMADFVKERAEECPERDDTTMLGRAHPERDDSRRSAFCQLIQSMQLAPLGRRPYSKHFYAEWRNAEAF